MTKVMGVMVVKVDVIMEAGADEGDGSPPSPSMEVMGVMTGFGIRCVALLPPSHWG